jgi:4-hydroxy-tetrahydrodipicolinate synthase
MFQGSLVALVTPMHNSGEIDYQALQGLVEWHLQQGTDGLVVLGTTGEAPTINGAERKKIVDLVIKLVDGQVPVIVGTGTNSTHSTITLSQEAMTAGASACLIVSPYYNKPTQEGLYQHYKAIADAVPVPQILYNVPGRTGCDLLPETVARIAKDCSHVVALKDASGKLERLAQLQDLGCDITLLTGNDDNTFEFMQLGGRGVISVTANVAPAMMMTMVHALLAGDIEVARSINQQLMNLHMDLFLESNPIPVKWALHEMGMIDAGIRLPLTPLHEKFRVRVKELVTTIRHK